MISVVLASCRSNALLFESLAALLPQCRLLGAELVVARATPDQPDPALPSGCRVIPCPANATIPELRGAGLTAARGDWVALTEDNCLATPNWLVELSAGFSGDATVVGGTMGNAHPGRPVDSGAAFAEYGFFGPDQPAAAPGAAPLVTGANVAYHRSLVGQVAEWAVAGAWEDVIHGRLAVQGAVFRVMRRAVIEQNLHYRLADFCVDRYQHGRDYARVRSSGLAPLSRIAHAAATPLLPPLLTSRVWRSAGRTAPASFLRALPFTLAFLSAWAVGEAVGYLVPRSPR
ncbi:MAG: hypothetical protein ABIZ70_10625 [Gemmatimonadales bacterium]